MLLLGSSSAWAADISQCELRKRQARDEIQLLDVRSEREYRAGHIAGATLIPHSQISRRLHELDKTKPTVIYCHSGRRAALAGQQLADNGFNDISLLQGHWLGWQKNRADDSLDCAGDL